MDRVIIGGDPHNLSVTIEARDNLAAQAGSGTASARLTRRDPARAVTRAQPS